MVDTDSSIPSRAYCSLCRLSGWWLAYFSTSIIASRLGPAKPRAIAWNGAGGCEILSDLGEIAATTARARGRRRMNDAPARQIGRKAAPRRLAPVEALHLDAC